MKKFILNNQKDLLYHDKNIRYVVFIAHSMSSNKVLKLDMLTWTNIFAAKACIRPMPILTFIIDIIIVALSLYFYILMMSK